MIFFLFLFSCTSPLGLQSSGSISTHLANVCQYSLKTQQLQMMIGCGRQCILRKMRLRTGALLEKETLVSVLLIDYMHISIKLLIAYIIHIHNVLEMYSNV